MKKLSKTIKTYLIVSIILSLLFVLGIPMIVLGASGITDVNWLNRLIMICGIVFTAGGFYSMPFMWLGYADKRSLIVIVRAVTELELLTVEEISAHTGLTPQIARKKLETCLEKGYIEGFIRNGNSLKKPKRKSNRRSVLCPSCGARVEFFGDDGICPYCKSSVQSSDATISENEV